MTFINWVNNNIFILALVLGLLLFWGLKIGFSKGGGRHIVYLWTLGVFVPYFFLSPLFMYYSGITSVVGTDISGYYGLHFFFSILGVFFFIAGYWMATNISPDRWFDLPKFQLLKTEQVLTKLFIATYGIVMINMAVGGINIADVFIGNKVIGLGAKGASYYLQNFADSLICVLVLGYLYDVPKKKLLTGIFFAFFLFFLLGFRYRIILSIGGLALVYLIKNKVTSRQVFQGVMLGLLGFYFIIFSTINRFALVDRRYSELVFNPLEFPVEGIFEQTRGALADMAVYKLYDNPLKGARHDYGATITLYVFIRVIPRAILPNKDEFYPPPQLKTTVDAYDPWWATFTGEATLSSGAIYIAWGWLGITLGHFLWGVLLRRFTNSVKKSDPLSVATFIVVALACFQWISRGYFPQSVDHFAYMMIPIWALQYIRKKQHANH